jgi:sulfate transport system permease protein
MLLKRHSPLPGFGLSLGFTVLYLGILLLLPLAALAVRALQVHPAELWAMATTPRALAAYRLSFGAALVAALLNAVIGSVLAWVLTRYDFPGRRLMDALIDFPFALPTAVAGLTLTDLFAPGGWLGRFLTPLGIHGAFTPLGVVLALTFVGLPFVVRTLQPVLESMEVDLEEAAATLGASRLRTLCQVVFPLLLPPLLTGFALAFARAVGEFGSVIFISGNLPYRTEIAPYLIVMRLEEFDYPGALSLAVVLLGASFLMLALINTLERWAARFQS